jgi:hypothetical protein
LEKKTKLKEGNFAHPPPKYTYNLHSKKTARPFSSHPFNGMKGEEVLCPRSIEEEVILKSTRLTIAYGTNRLTH